MRETGQLMADRVGLLLAGLAAGLAIGVWQGSSSAEERFRRMLLYADLPPACEQMLRDGSESAAQAGEAAGRDPFN